MPQLWLGQMRVILFDRDYDNEKELILYQLLFFGQVGKAKERFIQYGLPLKRY